MARASSVAAPSTTDRPRWALGLVAVAYLYVFPYFPEINDANENSRFYMTAAIVEDGTYELSGPRGKWGWTNDQALYEGRYYSVKAPGSSLLGVPAYAAYLGLTQRMGLRWDRAVALWLCRITASIVPMLVFLALFRRWLASEVRSRVASNAVFFSVALGSLLYSYALLFVSHAVAAAAGFASFMLLHRAHRRGQVSRLAAFAAGLCAAAVTLFEYPGLIISLALSAWAVVVVRPWPRLALYAVGGLIPTALVMHFQWAAFDSPWLPGHLYVENDLLRAAHHEGVYGADGFHWNAAARLLFDPGFGLLPMTPLLALAAPGYFLLLRDRAQRTPAAVALACAFLTYIAICFMNNWRGGWTVGPRYLAGVVPFLAWPAAVALGRWLRHQPRVATVIAIAGLTVGLVASGVPAGYYPHVPPEFTRPLTELFPVLIAHDYAPFNAGSFLGLYGTASMLPLVIVGAAVVGWLVRSLASPRRAALAVGGLAVAGLALTLFSLGAPSVPPHSWIALVTRSWSPKGHDTAARLSGELQAQPSAAGYERLVARYLEEGRDAEARAAQRARDALPHSLR